MAGIAIKIMGANYSASGLGKVTLKGAAVPVTAITINGNASITNTGQYTAVLTPNNTTQTRVVWSITSGSNYATIDQNGIVTAKSGASNSSVTIKCTSADNGEIFATKTISVTYAVPLTGIAISGSDSVTDSEQFAAVLTPSNTTQTGVSWSITSGSNYASIDQNGIVTAKDGANSSSVVIKCTSTANSSISATKTITVTKSQQEASLVSDGLIRNYDAFGATSTTLNDTSGSNNGTINFGGSNGQNTINNNKITAPNSEPYFHVRNLSNTNWLNGLSQWTLEFVVHMNGWVGNTNVNFDLFHDTSAEGAAKHTIYMKPDGNVLTTNGGIHCRTNSSSWQGLPWENSVLDIDWSIPHVIHVTRELNEQMYSFKLYIDGQYFSKAEGIVAGMRASYSQKADFLMAEKKNSSLPAAERSMYALRCYNRALSAAEVAQNFAYNVNRYGFSNNN